MELKQENLAYKNEKRRMATKEEKLAYEKNDSSSGSRGEVCRGRGEQNGCVKREGSTGRR